MSKRDQAVHSSSTSQCFHSLRWSNLEHQHTAMVYHSRINTRFYAKLGADMKDKVTMMMELLSRTLPRTISSGVSEMGSIGADDDPAILGNTTSFIPPHEACEWCDCGGKACMTEDNKVVVDWTVTNLFGKQIMDGLEKFASKFQSVG